MSSALAEPAPKFLNDGKPAHFCFKDPDEKTKPPRFVAFSQGTPVNSNEDIQPLLNELIAFRDNAYGPSHHYPRQAGEKGIDVLLNCISIVPRKDGQYDAIFYGEFQGVETSLKKSEIEDLLNGKSSLLHLSATIGIRPYRVSVDLTIDGSFGENEWRIEKVTADVKYLYGAFRVATYESETVNYAKSLVATPGSKPTQPLLKLPSF